MCSTADKYNASLDSTIRKAVLTMAPETPSFAGIVKAIEKHIADKIESSDSVDSEDTEK